MSDFFTTPPRSTRVIPSAPQSGGDSPPPVLGTPRVSEPRRPGDSLPEAVAHKQRVAAQRMQPCCICRGMAVDEKLPPNYIALVCAPHREARRQAQREARAACHPVAARLGTAERSGRSYDRSAPNHEKPCTHCDKPRAKHGSYCAEHKAQHARARRGMAPPFEPARTIAAPRAADVIAARRAARQKPVSEIGNTDLLEPPTKEPQMAAKTSEKCTHCDRAKLPSGPYCSDHKRKKNDEYLARKAKGETRPRAKSDDLPPLSDGAKRIAEKPSKQVVATCAKCNKPRGKNAYCQDHDSERRRESRKVKAGDVVSTSMGPGVVQPAASGADEMTAKTEIGQKRIDVDAAFHLRSKVDTLPGPMTLEQFRSYVGHGSTLDPGPDAPEGPYVSMQEPKPPFVKLRAPLAGQPLLKPISELWFEQLVKAARRAVEYLIGRHFDKEAKTIALELFDAVSVAP